MGANLARGRVRGDCIECPFHHWQFDCEGGVKHVPYSDRPPGGVLASTYPLVDVHGDLYLFHRCDGSPEDVEQPPPYQAPRLPEVDSGQFVPRGRHSIGRVGMHIVEIAENGVDSAHFLPLHGRFRVPWTQIPIPGVEIVHRAEWSVSPERAWVSHADDNAILRVLGRQVSAFEARVRVSYIGPGSLLCFRFDLAGWGEIALYQTLLPVSPLEQQVDLRWFADRRLPRLLVWYIIGNWISQFVQDIEIWENKIHVPQPRLCRDDGPIYEMRRWYRQFLP
ncbi:MAG: Rieske 2Fe-2S domain-containing protein [Chloroflexi bacterium]|nr:Rieske 2Fe-2S domain-containing protein [Chloroflexota bacterium]